MNVVCIGGGPAGLYLGILLKRQDPAHRVVVYERNRPSDTFGFGVVFSYATLGNLEQADPESYQEISRSFARWDDIEIHVRGQVLRSTGHGFCGLERKQLLAILQARAAALGVEVHYDREVRSLDAPELAGADVIVAADGVASWVREACAPALGPSVDVRPNKFVWLGTTVPYRAFTFLFKETAFGLFRIHAYPYSADRSTFIAECRPETWQRAGLDTADEDRTVAVLESLFSEELAGHRLIKNRSIWRNFPTVRCERWYSDNVVIVGDAAHTAHFSIGSGTKLAMEDSIELAAALAAAQPSSGAPSRAAITAALATYQAKRMPEVESLQAAAQVSMEWFEGTERTLGLPPAQFAYNLMTRSLRVSHASMRKRDPELVDAVEPLLAGGLAGVAPRQTESLLAGHRLGGRLVAQLLAGDELPPSASASLAALGAPSTGLAPRIAVLDERMPGDEAAALLRAVSELPAEAWHHVIAVVARRPAEVLALRAVAPAKVAVGLVVSDEPPRRAELVAELAELAKDPQRAPAFALVVPAQAEAAELRRGTERLAAVPLADRLRNELGLPVLVALEGDARLEDIDAVIAAGRADLVVLPVSAALWSAAQ